METTNVRELKNTLEACLADGMTKRSAVYYLAQLEGDRNNPAYDPEYATWAHRYGFFAQSAYTYGLNETNLGSYLSDYDFWKAWPLNNWSRIWVNDKLTLKLMLSDKELAGFMPEYYYYCSEGTLKPLTDADHSAADTFAAFLEKLREKKEFACKPCNGSKAKGFIRLSFENGHYYAGGAELNEQGVAEFVRQHPNYLFTEYLRPSAQFAGYSPIIHTLRIVVVNETGSDPKIAGGYLRIPHSTDEVDSNLITLSDHDPSQYNLYCDVNLENGSFGSATKCFCNRLVKTGVHPDTGKLLEGTFPDFEALKEKIFFIARKFSNLEYYGFDIGFTEDGPKCMEINTQPGVQYMQMFHPIYRDPVLGSYYEKKMAAIAALDKVQKEKRNQLLR